MKTCTTKRTDRHYCKFIVFDVIPTQQISSNTLNHSNPELDHEGLTAFLLPLRFYRFFWFFPVLLLQRWNYFFMTCESIM